MKQPSDTDASVASPARPTVQGRVLPKTSVTGTGNSMIAGPRSIVTMLLRYCRYCTQSGPSVKPSISL